MKLEGIRVVDLSLFLPGPHLSMMMADHGADVIKVEPPGEGDPGRHIGLVQDGHSVFFRNANRGKRSVCLNLKDPAAREVLLKLVDTADVFIEAFRPGVAKRLGFDAETLRARNPRLIYASISAFGQTGPYRDVPAHDLAVEALSGVLSVNLGPDDRPAQPGVPASDMAASLMAFSGILMALYRREKSGAGDTLDIAMHDSLVAWMPNILGTVFAENRAPVAKHERTWGGSGFYRIYRTKDDRYVVLGGQEIKFARYLLGEWGRPDLAPLAERGPGPHQLPMVEFLAQQFATRTQAEWVEWFRGRTEVSFAPVKDLREAVEDPHVLARGMVLTDAAGVRHLGVPIRFETEPGSPQFAVPALGEHTAEILAGLGYDAARIDALKASGALG
jgi:crotonobetainyl-CoA:carnitine CoA-transferase CaiB-like acyl-CoA transferase